MRFSVPLRIRILENNDRADRTDVIEIKKNQICPWQLQASHFLDSHLTTGWRFGAERQLGSGNGLMWGVI